MKRLEFLLYAGSPSTVPCDTLVVPVPADERPLGGEAGWVDWRVCGAISRHLASGYVSGEKEEVVLLPPHRPLGAARLLLVGLGPAPQLEGRGLQRAMTLACEKILSLRGGVALVALPAAIDFALDAAPLARGCFASLVPLRGEACLEIALASGLQRARTLEAALAGLSQEALDKGVELVISWPEAEMSRPEVRP